MQKEDSFANRNPSVDDAESIRRLCWCKNAYCVPVNLTSGQIKRTTAGDKRGIYGLMQTRLL